MKRVWKRREGERLNGASAVDDVDGFLCAKGESAWVAAAGVLVEERDIYRACAGRDWERRRLDGPLVPLGAGWEIGEVCACKEKTDEKAKQRRQRHWCLCVSRIAQTKKVQYGKQQQDKPGSGKGDWKKGDVEESKEKSDRPNETRVEEDVKTVS